MTNFTVDYRREYGVHEFETSQGHSISVVSAGQWSEFDQYIRQGDFSGSEVILTPELMTTPGSLEGVADNMHQVHERTLTALEQSQRFPESTLMLGSATISHRGNNPYNSLVFIKNGRRVGIQHKNNLVHGGDADHMTPGKNEDTKIPFDESIATLICADVIQAYVQVGINYIGRKDMLSDRARTLLISACWAVPLANYKPEIKGDERYKPQLEAVMARLFEGYLNLQDVIIADRSTPASGVDGPFNAHFSRA